MPQPERSEAFLGPGLEELASVHADLPPGRNTPKEGEGQLYLAKFREGRQQLGQYHTGVHIIYRKVSLCMYIYVYSKTYRQACVIS